jgi:hypothetical protein
MYQAIIKSKTKANLKALSRHGIDFKGNSAIYDKKDFMFRVDAIISDQDKKRLNLKVILSRLYLIFQW